MFYRHLSVSLGLQCKIDIIRSILIVGKVGSFRSLKINKIILYHQNPQIRMLSVTNCLHVEDKVQNNLEQNVKKRLRQELNKLPSLSKEDISEEYTECIRDLNLLQSNTQTLALAKYKRPEEILPLFIKQLELSGLKVSDLDNLNIIHVSGTKGKGSTCAFVESILRFGGKKTGFYNSPHLIKVTERIRIDGKPISDDKFSKYFRQVYDRLRDETSKANITMPSYFSFLTILAFHIFLAERVDCAIVEVGIGGEFDPTNVIKKPIACGITTLDFDHTNILGNSIKDIAWSKAGILKTSVPVFVVDGQPEVALEVIKSRCDEKHCPMYICKPLGNSSTLELGIQGSVQYTNAAIASQLSSYLLGSKSEYGLEQVPASTRSDPAYVETNLTRLPAFFKEALTNCSWPGRCQILRYPKVIFFLDGAHTKKSMQNCLEWFLDSSSRESVNSRKILLLNIIGDRDKSDILNELCRYDGFESVIFSSNRINSAGVTSKSETFLNIQGPNSDRSMENVHKNAKIWNDLCQKRKTSHLNTTIMSNTRDSIESILERTKLNPEVHYHVLVTGSLHFVGAVSETLVIMDEMMN